MSLAPEPKIIKNEFTEEENKIIKESQKKGRVNRQTIGALDESQGRRELERKVQILEKKLDLLLEHIDVFSEQIVFNQNVSFRSEVYNRTGTKVIN